MQVRLVFEKPSQELYYAWVYTQGDGMLELRSFMPAGGTPEDGRQSVEALSREWSLDKYWFDLDS